MACEKDYSKGIIYTIKTDDGLYVGSTCDFKDRKRSHKSSIYNENSARYNLNLYQNIRANDGEYRIEMYKPFPCENGIELRQEEERIRIELDANLNGKRAYISAEERKEEGKEYREKNKDEMSAYFKLYRENNRDELNAYSKLYSENNRDSINAYSKRYNKKNRDKINTRQREKITCECGCDITRNRIYKHRKTKKHLNLMKELNDPQCPS